MSRLTVSFALVKMLCMKTGLFQGRLGFSRAIILLEEGTEDFSNVHGVQQIRFAKGNIKETFGEALATLKREFDK
jgi:predicted nucleotide-binding protein